MNPILIAFLVFAGVAGILGLLLAFAARVFAVRTDERIEKITELLPGANCGGCGYTGCAALAEAIVAGKAPVNACNSVSDANVEKIAAIMGAEAGKRIRYRAQVMCSGTHDLAKKKYIYAGIADCAAANKLAGGDKLCPNGCIGLGTCKAHCKFDAIHIINGVAAVDYDKCRACGECVASCPKGLIKLIPYDARHWVGCRSTDKGPVTKSYCDAGCIGCKLCEKNCEAGAIKVTDFVAEIDYTKCVGCDKCVSVCPRKIIWSDTTQESEGLTIEKPVVHDAPKSEEADKNA